MGKMTIKVCDLVKYTIFFLFLTFLIFVKKGIYNKASMVEEAPYQPAADCCSTGRTIGLVSDWKHRINYSQIATAIPRLDADYRSATLTRLGTDLNFSCPHNSLMLEARSSVPLHDNCPTVFVIGARKAGTTSLYQYLSNHSGETFYFSDHYQSRSWEDYLKHFPSDGVMTGDSSVGNLVNCLVPQRIFESCGKQAKIIILLRNPIKRFVSNFLMRARLSTRKIRNTTALTTVVKSELDAFFAAVFQNNIISDVTQLPHKWTDIRCLFHPSANMVFEGLYYMHVLNWLCNFPAENILIISSEEFYRNTSAILKQVFQFSGLKPLPQETLSWITSTVYNKGKYSNTPSYQRLTLKDMKKLNSVYEPFNRALFELLDWKTVNWL